MPLNKNAVSKEIFSYDTAFYSFIGLYKYLVTSALADWPDKSNYLCKFVETF